MAEPLLGDKLVALRAVQWIMGLGNDPYALLLRTASDDPHELGRRMRDRGELYRSHAGAWVTARHRVGQHILRNPRLSPRPPGSPGRGKTGGGQEVPTLRTVLPPDDAYLAMDRAEYVRLDRLVDSADGCGIIDRACARTTSELAADLRGRRGEFDLAVLAWKLAARTAGELLGVRERLRDRFAESCAGAAGVLDAVVCPPRLPAARELVKSVAELRELMSALTGAGPGSWPDGLPGALAGAGARAEDVQAVGVLMSAAGAALTASLICHAAAALLDHPDQWRSVCADRGLAGGAIEETLRWAPPVRLHVLFATADLDLAGQRVGEGDQVAVVVQAAGRDPAAHPDPDRFDISRPASPDRLALPAGLPGGVVSRLARATAAAAIGTLTAELPGLRRAGPAVRRLRSPVTAAVLRLPVTTAQTEA